MELDKIKEEVINLGVAAIVTLIIGSLVYKEVMNPSPLIEGYWIIWPLEGLLFIIIPMLSFIFAYIIFISFIFKHSEKFGKRVCKLGYRENMKPKNKP